MTESPPPPPPPPWPSNQPGNGGGQPQFPGYGYAATAEHPDGTTVIVLGVLSLLLCGLLGPIAWAKGNAALNEIKANPSVTYSNRSSIVAGRICGIIATVMLIIVALGIVLFVIGAAAGR